VAQRVEVQLLDDLAQLDGKEVEADHGTAGFSLDGHDYEIDLTSSHYKTLCGALDPYIKVARKANSERKTTATSFRPGSQRAERKTLGTAERVQEIIRRWAVDNDISVPSEGPLPTDVVRQYRQKRRLVTRDDSQGGTVTGKTPLFSGADNGGNGSASLPLPQGGFPDTKAWLTHQRRFAEVKGLPCARKARIPTPVTEAWIVEYGLPTFANA
jgi:nucleoid-associated protein Lsr2